MEQKPIASAEVCRSPCGERGLKSICRISPPGNSTSLPVRGAWVEMCRSGWRSIAIRRRSPCGERGLKSAVAPSSAPNRRRSPCGERGLKLAVLMQLCGWAASLPVRGAWVEIVEIFGAPESACRSPCGERGLKYAPASAGRCTQRRSPCGERGLKSLPRAWAHHARARRSPCGERGLKW